ncbi:hypothetical protein, partial [Klebsiella pneumoniae]|uniref:hypothetical protein n=1 Tax=Klebsiella pneumoniae TaxID=573 RepID=UPI001C6FE08D
AGSVAVSAEYAQVAIMPVATGAIMPISTAFSHWSLCSSQKSLQSPSRPQRFHFLVTAWQRLCLMAAIPVLINEIFKIQSLNVMRSFDAVKSVEQIIIPDYIVY